MAMSDTILPSTAAVIDLLSYMTLVYGGGYIVDEEGLKGFDSHLIYPDSEFCFSLNFTPEWIDTICYNGYFPMADDFGLQFDKYQRLIVLLIKHHHERAVLRLEDQIIPKNIKKFAKNLIFSIDTDFDACLQGVWEQHGQSWLYSELSDAFLKMHPGHALSDAPFRTTVHSVELYDAQTGELAAGELGFLTGSLYTSLTGFTRRNSCGSVQLAVLGRFLKSQGAAYWDLGMNLPYKMRMGCSAMSWSDFSRIHASLKDIPFDFSCQPVTAEGILCL